MKTIVPIILISFLMTCCSSSKLIQQYKNPSIVFFQSNKVLIIGLEADFELRKIFEKLVVKAFENENIRTVKSIDFFNPSFIKKKQSVEELNKIEKSLLNAGFDAILITKILGKEKRYHASTILHGYMTSNQTFEDYYYRNQYLYLKQKGKKEDYTIYFIETSLYCICPDKERELLWRGEIEIYDSKDIEKNIGQYITILFKTLKNNKLLIH